MVETVFSKREWISAQASYATQAAELVAMVDRLHDQIATLSPKRPDRIRLIGIGASHAAAASAAFVMRDYHLDAVRFLPSELPRGWQGGLSGDEGLTVLISQSGRSAEVVALAAQSNAGAQIAITNYAPSPLGTLCQAGLGLGNLADSSVSFVSFTGTLLALALLADHWAGKTEIARWKERIASCAEAVERMDAELIEIARMLVGASSIDVVAPAPFMSAAEETALMLREGPRLFATAMETRQYLHGPMDAAGTGAHLVFGGEREALLIDQLSERSDKLVFVSGRSDAEANTRAGHQLTLPADLDDTMGFTIAATFISQKLTLHAADIRGIDINDPAFKRLDTKTDRIPTGQ
jgi:glucosamine--fructose-6-phosphate aminotransferase (isomerizing)